MFKNIFTTTDATFYYYYYKTTSCTKTTLSEIQNSVVFTLKKSEHILGDGCDGELWLLCLICVVVYLTLEKTSNSGGYSHTAN